MNGFILVLTIILLIFPFDGILLNKYKSMFYSESVEDNVQEELNHTDEVTKMEMPVPLDDLGDNSSPSQQVDDTSSDVSEEDLIIDDDELSILDDEYDEDIGSGLDEDALYAMANESLSSIYQGGA